VGRTLQPEDVIAHYRVVGPLGAGGMGEVYLAHDMKLERDVALKVLPPEVVRSQDRVKRFILEAKSASSLSHPHIITIYDIGHHPVQSEGETEAGGEEIHYIAMELVNGKTLHDHIHNDKTDLRTILGYLAQAAEGLSKAHAAGIVHRDLKPGNIMVTNDGYAKVLDFGLAKLTEKGSTEADVTSAPTEVGRTTPGTLVGTVDYMSPEQVKGKKVDHRSDIFSFGAILYEAATLARPFAAESKFDTMHKIVHDTPVPIDEINTGVPAELRRLIKRCLAKNADQRLQSSKDLAIELREIVDEFDTLSATATSASGVTPGGVSSRPGRGMSPFVIVIAILGIAGLVFGIWSLRGRLGSGSSADQRFESLRMRSLMDDDRVVNATLSGDGRYLAYVRGPSGQWSLWVRQVATGSDAQILGPQSNPVLGVNFSPDGNYLYYLGVDPDTPNYKALFEVPSLGGTPRKRIFDVDTALAFSPDGKRAAFVRGVSIAHKYNIVVTDLQADQQTVLASVEAPEQIHFSQPAWSPDGKRIVVVWHSSDQGTRHALVSFDATTGARELVTDPAPPNFGSIAWLPDGSGLVATTAPDPGQPSQIFFVPYPRGQARRITNDLNDYGDISLSSDGKAIAALTSSFESSLWVAPILEPGNLRQISPRSGKDRIGGLVALENGALLFTADKDGQRPIWRMNEDGSGRLQLTSQAGWSETLNLLPGDDGIVFTHVDEALGVGQVWRGDTDGGNLRPITKGPGGSLIAVDPGGRSLLFFRQDSINETWRVSLEGGEPEKFVDGRVYPGSYSPDGRYVFYTRSEEVGGRTRQRLFIIPSDGGDAVGSFLPPGDASGFSFTWDPDGESLTYYHAVDGVGNLYRERIDGGDPEQVTRFSEGELVGHNYSPDGRMVALQRVVGDAANLWTMKPDGSGAAQVTDFREGFIGDFAWSRDSKRLLLVHGETKRQVVLLEQPEGQ